MSSFYSVDKQNTTDVWLTPPSIINALGVIDIEFVDKGEKRLIRSKFRSGPFNKIPIKFETESNYSKIFDTHVVLNTVLGALSINRSYFIVIDNGEIRIDKMQEVM